MSPGVDSGDPPPIRGHCLHYVIFLGFHNLKAFLLREFRQDLNAQSFDYNGTPLHVALRGEGRHVKFRRVLLSHGADVGSHDVD